MAEAEEAALQFTPTWIVAAVCSIIVLISLAAERGLHHLGKVRKTPGLAGVLLAICFPADAADGHRACRRSRRTIRGRSTRRSSRSKKVPPFSPQMSEIYWTYEKKQNV